MIEYRKRSFVLAYLDAELMDEVRRYADEKEIDVSEFVLRAVKNAVAESAVDRIGCQTDGSPVDESTDSAIATFDKSIMVGVDTNKTVLSTSLASYNCDESLNFATFIREIAEEIVLSYESADDAQTFKSAAGIRRTHAPKLSLLIHLDRGECEHDECGKCQFRYAWQYGIMTTKWCANPAFGSGWTDIIDGKRTAECLAAEVKDERAEVCGA